MSNSRKATLARRQFLKGAAATAGAALMGPSALAKSIAKVSNPYTVLYWEQDGFLDARRMGASSAKIDRVRVTVSGAGTGPIQALDSLFFIPTSKGSKQIGFKSWLPGSTTTRFEMPVHGRHGISFQVTSASLGRTVRSTVQFARSGGNLRLREGDYVIVPSGQSIAGLRLEKNQDTRLVQGRNDHPAQFQHVILTIERA